MIKIFKDKEAEKLFNNVFSKHFPNSIRKAALKQLYRLNYAQLLSDLANPPSNHLEILTGDYQDKWSIRINKQWRVVFKPIDGGKNYEEVEIVDYH